MKKITKYAFLILLGMILMWNHPIQSVKAQGEDDLTKEYDEDLDLYILKNGDVVYHWEITDQGMYVDFPVSLSPPNSTTSAIEDAVISLSVFQITPKPHDFGLEAAQYGGFMNWDLPGNDYEYGFSHLKLDVELFFDDIQNVSLGMSWLDNLISQLEIALNVDFLQYYNYSSISSDRWYCNYRAFPQQYDDIWNLVLEPFPCGNTTLLPQSQFLESDNKAIRILAEWDEDEEFRWEYETDLELYKNNKIQIEKESETSVYFNNILEYNGNLLLPTWVNESNLNIYLYKGAKISSVYPGYSDETQDRGHIERDLHYYGDHYNSLSAQANFNFTDTQESEPILNCFLTVDDTTVNYEEDITVTALITNVGGQTAYNIDIDQDDDYELISDGNFNLTSGTFLSNIDLLNPGESYETQLTLRCNHNSDRDREYQFDVAYDAISDLGLANHWSQPQTSGGRFTSSSNRIKIFQNDVDPEPWMVVSYNVTNLKPNVGENITINATIKNIGDVYASNIQWKFNQFLGYVYPSDLGFNWTDDSGIIERMDPGESINVSTLYTVDAYNRYYGGDCSFSCDLSFYNQNDTTTDLYIDSYDLDDNDAGSSRYLIYPQEEQVFGPLLIFNEVVSAPSNEIGSIVTIEFTVTNIGTTPAYNVNPHVNYFHSPGPDQYFYLERIEGNYLDFYFGTLYPGESINYKSRFKLLQNLSLDEISVTPYIAYSIRSDSDPFYMVPNQIASIPEKEGLSGQSIWMIVALTAIAALIGESFIFYKKVKM
ncbi:MAG: hypothetical protein ACTSPA_04395 [Promethearchaeota archaeon]